MEAELGGNRGRCYGADNLDRIGSLLCGKPCSVESNSALESLCLFRRRLGRGLVLFFGAHHRFNSCRAPLEEVFYRSFIYRYLISYNFLEVPLKTLRWDLSSSPLYFLVSSITNGLLAFSAG